MKRAQQFLERLREGLREGNADVVMMVALCAYCSVLILLGILVTMLLFLRGKG
jgi:hypothetical protein